MLVFEVYDLVDSKRPPGSEPLMTRPLSASLLNTLSGVALAALFLALSPQASAGIFRALHGP